ncbi:hypothetical protein [Reichenbachiella ulvae]|uniref:YARHG domain-containing protein n=1 Tax=Reichenbachiella ulvae TaxID=2980104 RepID=A0ABT3CXE6_9BACT|nr:hypothetical protein [Reichenbachiella ulvae]MCV9388155.1 hypothetical protein [Reichenbachiella ulvae]
MIRSIYIVSVFFSFALCVLFSSELHAQEEIKKELPTRKVDRKVKEDVRRNQPDIRDYNHIYIKDGKSMLYGNRCALEATHQMGFEYVLEHRPEQSFKSKWYRFKNNFWVKSKLCVTRGPWWKLTVNKRLKECAKLSGDSRG